ncbi:uncharacterized protein VSU04_012531 isoform 1-T2 [Chlamydotis macqueenii]
MARPVLPLLSGIVAFLLPWAVADTVPPRCSRPKDVANAHIDAGNDAVLHTLLRYTCNPGYKRKAGTSSLIQCILRDGSAEPEWTHTTLQCIRTTDVSRNSSPLPAATSGPLDAASQSPVPPAPDGPSPETAMPPEMSPPLDASTPGEGMALGTTMVPAAPADRATVSIETLASSIGKLGKKLILASRGLFSLFFSLKVLFGAVGGLYHGQFILHRRGTPPRKDTAPKFLPGEGRAPL